MKCPNCNAETINGICDYCGCQVQSTTNPTTQQPINIVINNSNTNTNTNVNNGRVYVKTKVSDKKKSSAIGLSCLGFIGIAGIHRFYVGKIGSGIFYLFTMGGFFIGTIADIRSLSKGTFTDKNGLPLK